MFLEYYPYLKNVRKALAEMIGIKKLQVTLYL